MSTREIQDIAYRKGVFLFEGGNQNEGMIVPRYNIPQAKIEYYFIPSSRIADYNSAKARADQDAHRYYGNLVPEGAIQRATI
jgi:hypothetical protein